MPRNSTTRYYAAVKQARQKERATARDQKYATNHDLEGQLRLSIQKIETNLAFDMSSLQTVIETIALVVQSTCTESKNDYFKSYMLSGLKEEVSLLQGLVEQVKLEIPQVLELSELETPQVLELAEVENKQGLRLR